MNAQMLFFVRLSASLAGVGIALTTCAGLMLIVAMSFTIGDRAVYHGWRGDRGGDCDRQIGNIGGIDVASRRASFAVLPALDAHGTVVPASGLRLERFLANPVFCWMHRTGDTEARSADPDDVIGTVTDLRVEGDRLLFSVVFGSHDLADRCFRAVVEKRINACSISFNPIRQHAEGDAVIIDSNPEALALRSFIEATNPMNEILKKLGLEDGAGAGDILIALAQYLAKTDEDKALVDEVVKMLPRQRAF